MISSNLRNILAGNLWHLDPYCNLCFVHTHYVKHLVLDLEFDVWKLQIWSEVFRSKEIWIPDGASLILLFPSADTQAIRSISIFPKSNLVTFEDILEMNECILTLKYVIPFRELPAPVWASLVILLTFYTVSLCRWYLQVVFQIPQNFMLISWNFIS